MLPSRARAPRSRPIVAAAGYAVVYQDCRGRYRSRRGLGLGLALVAPSAVAARLTYAAVDKVDWPIGLPLALGDCAGISAGVVLAHRLTKRALQLLFGLLLLAAAAMLVRRG